MTDSTEWARKNKKNIAREFIRKIDRLPSKHPSGIFTAGLPGAGKTEFTKELIKEISGTEPLRIDMDEIACLIEGYSPKKANLFRLGASVILAKIYDLTIKTKLDFIFDGTFGHEHAMENLERAIHAGYTVKLYFIYQEPEIAWKFTSDRELTEFRSIDREGFLETYNQLYLNISKLRSQHKDVTVSVIIKTTDNKVGQRVENVEDILKVIPRKLSQQELENVIME